VIFILSIAPNNHSPATTVAITALFATSTHVALTLHAQLIPIYLLLIQPSKRSVGVMVKNAGPMSLVKGGRSASRASSSHHRVLQDFSALLQLVFPPIHSKEMLNVTRACAVETPLATYHWRPVGSKVWVDGCESALP
jgi:hypothetical protein